MRLGSLTAVAAEPVWTRPAAMHVDMLCSSATCRICRALLLLMFSAGWKSKKTLLCGTLDEELSSVLLTDTIFAFIYK
ncbi:hypothetical protein STEG23_023951, partial [Scotinomys teguina]